MTYMRYVDVTFWKSDVDMTLCRCDVNMTYMRYGDVTFCTCDFNMTFCTCDVDITIGTFDVDVTSFRKILI